MSGTPKRPRVGSQRATVARRITSAAQALLVSGTPVSRHVLDDACAQVGIRPSLLRSLFPTDDALLDAVYEELVSSCERRLAAGVSAFSPTGDGDPLEEAAAALAAARPIDRGGMVIRAERRLRHLRSGDDGRATAAAERHFVGSLTGVLTELVHGLGREFAWPPTLAVRIVVDTYERSFEAWLLNGNSEADFVVSPYILRTLPRLLDRLSRERTD